jgi:hypothetical protein
MMKISLGLQIFLGEGGLNVERDHLPVEIVNCWHAFMGDVGEGVPGKRWEAAVAGSGTGSHPEKSLFVETVARYLAVDQSVSVDRVGLISSWCYANTGIGFLINIHPFFDVLFVVHRFVVVFEGECARIVLVGVLICMFIDLQCWYSSLL